MFRYINMPKLVAYYLKEFSVRSDGTPSTLYKFILGLCVPFVSPTFRRARLNALAVAECTNSGDQIRRVLEKITGVRVAIETFNEDYFAIFGTGDDSADFPYDSSDNRDNALVPYASTANRVYVYVTLNGASPETVDAYLQLLVPFYIEINVIYS